jgi:hypothetical protein
MIRDVQPGSKNSDPDLFFTYPGSPAPDHGSGSATLIAINKYKLKIINVLHTVDIYMHSKIK